MSLSPNDKAVTLEALPVIVGQCFPKEMPLSDGRVLTRNMCTSEELSTFLALRFVGLIDAGIGPIYRRVKGRYWKGEKKQELLDEPLVHVWYTENNNVVSLVSTQYCDVLFDETYNMVTVEQDRQREKTIFLYEIHVDRSIQGLGLGKILLESFFKEAKEMAKSYPKCTMTGLTCFVDNQKAFEWYRRHGFDIEATHLDFYNMSRAIKDI